MDCLLLVQFKKISINTVIEYNSYYKCNMITFLCYIRSHEWNVYNIMIIMILYSNDLFKVLDCY